MLTAPLDLYRPDQPRDQNGRFTADPGGNMRTQIRKHGERADFHDRKSGEAKAKGNQRMAAAHAKLAGSHRDIAKGLQEEHDLKHASGPKPAEHFVPNKRPSHSAKDWESFDKAAGNSTAPATDQKPELSVLRRSGDVKDEKHLDHLTPENARQYGKTDAILEYGDIKPGDHAAASKWHTEQRIRNENAAKSGSPQRKAYHEAKAQYHGQQASTANDAMRAEGGQKTNYFDQLAEHKKAMTGKATFKEGAAWQNPNYSEADMRERQKKFAASHRENERARAMRESGQGASSSRMLKKDPQRVVFIKGETYKNREMLRDMGATPVPGHGWAITAGAAKGIELPKGLRITEDYSRSITLSTGQTIGYDFAREGDENGHWVTIDGEHVFMKGPSSNNSPTSPRLEVLKKSLKKKVAAFDHKLSGHIGDVKSANGQPLNDKANGAATINRWERQNDSLRSLKQGIEKTKQAIEQESQKIDRVNSAEVPTFLRDMVAAGELAQWRNHPNTFFVTGVDKGRIVWNAEHQTLGHKCVSEIPKDQYPKFRDAFNKANGFAKQKRA